MQNNLKTFNDDKFDRKNVAINLTKILDSKTCPKVICIDSSWRTGKTTFITMFKDMLDNNEVYKNKFRSFYFNAWENDYIKEPLLAIFSEIDINIKEDDTMTKEFVNKTKPIINSVSRVLLKRLTKNILDSDNLLEDIKNEIDNSSNKKDYMLIDEVSKCKQLRVELKREMNDYQKNINKKIVFFIDELDRCRPNFAIELLEVIKHLFDIDNFIFMVAIDKEQLSHSIANIYGQNMDTEGYLRRFFDLDYKLPKIDTRQYIKTISDDIFKDYYNTEFLQFFLEEFINKKNFSLRDIDKTYYYVKLLLPLIDTFNNSDKTSKNFYIATIGYLYALSIVIKINKNDMYKELINGTYDIEKLKKYLDVIDISNKNSIYNKINTILLQDSLSDFLYKYLLLNYEFNNGMKKISEKYNDNYFEIGLKNKDGQFFDNEYYNLDNLFDTDTKKNIIHNNLEFIGNFNY